MKTLYKFKTDEGKRLEIQFYLYKKLNWLLSEEITYDNLDKIIDVNLYVYNISDNMAKVSQEELYAQGIENVHDIDWNMNFKTSSEKSSIEKILKYRI